MIYIDLNMVRAGAVNHPIDWMHGGYREIQYPPERYRIIDMPLLMQLCGVENISELQQQRRIWLENELTRGDIRRDGSWSGSIAVGSKTFVTRIHSSIEFLSRHREVIYQNGKYTIKDQVEDYNAGFRGKNDGLSRKNTVKLDFF